MSIIAVESQFSVLVLLCKHARTSTVVMRKRQHHQKAEVAASRPQYREARWERAVKVQYGSHQRISIKIFHSIA